VYEEGSSDPFENDNHLLAACRYAAGHDFFGPKYCADKEGDCGIEVFLLNAIFTLASCFRLIFERFREVFTEYLEPGGTISIAQDVLELRERLRPAPVVFSSCLVELR
jgi:hypothetical protein